MAILGEVLHSEWCTTDFLNPLTLNLRSNRSQMMSNCDDNKKVAHKVQQIISLMFLSHFDFFSDWLQYRHCSMQSILLIWLKCKMLLMMTLYMYFSICSASHIKKFNSFLWINFHSTLYRWPSSSINRWTSRRFSPTTPTLSWWRIR